MQNSTNLIPVDESSRFFRKDIVSFTNILTHLSFGKPNIPELIAGIEILSNPFRKQSSRQLLMALLNFSFSLPSPILGPTVCMIDLHGKIPLDVMVYDPT